MILEHVLGDTARLVGIVADRHELRLLDRLALAPEVLGEALAREPDHRIGRIQYRLRRAIVAVERNHPRRLRELRRKVENVAHRRCAKGIDRLRVVANHRHASPIGLERNQYLRLEAIGVLILVDEDVIETRPHFAGQRRVPRGLRPVQEQVVIVENVLRLLRRRVAGKELPQLVFPMRAPGEGASQHLGERCLTVDDARVNREARHLARKAIPRRRETEFMPDDGEQIFGIASIMNSE